MLAGVLLGFELELSEHSRASLLHRLLNANGVFANWRPILTNFDIHMSAKISAFTNASVEQVELAMRKLDTHHR